MMRFLATFIGPLLVVYFIYLCVAYFSFAITYFHATKKERKEMRKAFVVLSYLPFIKTGRFLYEKIMSIIM